MNIIPSKCSFAVICCLWSTAVFSQISINEWMSDNVSAFSDSSGEFDDWIELFNSGGEDVDLEGYYISDDPSEPQKFQLTSSLIVPSNGFVIIWADKDLEQGNNHVDFKLSSSGESILLSDPSGNLLDQVTFQNLDSDISMGAFPDGNSDYYFFSNHTPNASNNQIGNPAGLEKPSFSLGSGFYGELLQIEISASDSEANIYYTLDGSAPSSNSFLYSGAVPIDKTTVLRAISEKNGFPASKITSATYFYNTTTTLPTLSIVGDPADFFGSEGIYSHPYQSGSDWERYCQIQYFENNQLDFGVDCGIRIQGSSSVGKDKKSFRLFFESKYGDKWLKQDLFENNKVDKFRNLVLRAGYDDDLTNSTGTLLRDPYCSEAYRDLDGLTSDSKWVTLTINGDYWGIYEIRESVNKHFIETQNDWEDFDMIRFTKSGPELKEGSLDDWESMTTFLTENNMQIPSNYKAATNLIDEENLINLLAFVNVTAYTSWTWGVSAYKESKPNSKWKFTVWDMDRSLFLNGWNNFEAFDGTSGVYWANFIPKALVKNIDFRNKLLNKTADLMNSSFSPTNSLTLLNEVKGQISAEIDAELNRWVPGATFADWIDEVEDVEHFLTNRKETIQDQAVSEYGLPATNELILAIDGPGDLQVNSLNLAAFPWTGQYFESIPINIIAQPAPGYYFSHWSDNSLPNSPNITIDFQGTKNLTAYFSNGNTEQKNIVINEINYNSADSLKSGDWIELYNNGDDAATLSGWYVMDEGDNYFSIPQTILNAGEYLVVAEDLIDFSLTYPNVTNVIGAFGNQGDHSFGFSNSGEALRFINADSSFIDYVAYNDKAPWPISADGNGSSLQLISPELDNSLVGNWQGDYPTPGAVNLTGFKMSQTLSFDPLGGKIATDIPFDIVVSSSSMLGTNLELISGPASLNGNTVTLDGVSGELVFEANQAGNEDFFPASSLNFSVLVTKAPQSIEYTNIADQLPSAGTVNIIASASSNLPVAYELLSGPAMLSPSSLTLTGDIGEVVVSMTQVGDTTYLPANEKLIVFDVYKLEQSININDIGMQSTLADPITIQANTDSNLPLNFEIISGPASIDQNIITLDKVAGTVVFQAVQDGGGDYFPASEISSFEVVPAVQSIDFPILDNHLNTDLPFTISAESNSNLQISFEILSGPANISGDTIFLSGEIGIVEVQASQEGNETYAPALPAVRSFQVTLEPLLDQEITWNALEDKYTFDLPFTIAATASSGLSVGYEVESGPATILEDEVTLTGNPGTVVLRAIQAGDDDYNPAIKLDSFMVIEVVAQDQSIDFPQIGNHWNTDEDFMISATSSFGLPVSFEVISGPATIEGDMVHLTGAVGTVIVKALQAGNNFYNPAEVIQDFEVEMVSNVNHIFEGMIIELFPNPASNYVNITADLEIESIRMVNSIGQVTWATDLLTSKHEGGYLLNVEHIESGFYQVILTTSDNSFYTTKLLIQ